MLSMVATTLPQLVMFIVDKVVKEDRRLLLISRLESITQLGEKRDRLGLQRVTCSPSSRTWETASICSLQLEYLRKMFSLEAVGSGLTSFSKARVFSVSFILYYPTHFPNAPLSLACSKGLTLLFLLKQLSVEHATGSDVFLAVLTLQWWGGGW